MSRVEADEILSHVVVGLGGSERSFTALRYALELGKASGHPVRGVVVDTITGTLSIALAHRDALQHLVEVGERLARLEGDRIAIRAARIAKSAGAELRIEHQSGGVVECLQEASNGASLLVMGKRGDREAHDGFLGSNAELLARRVLTPVLLTPREFRPIREIIVAFAGKGPGAGNLAVAGVPVSFEALTGSVAAELCRISHRDAMLILGSSGRSRAYRFLLGDVTVETMRGASGPVFLSSKADGSV